MPPRTHKGPAIARVRCAVEPRHAAALLSSGGQEALLADVRERVRNLYDCDVLTASRDPTTGTVIVLVQDVRRTPPDPDPLIRPISAEVVDAPHVRSPARGDEHLRWDPGLTPAEAWAVERAVRIEDEPNHLRGFAGALEPFFPVAASALRRRGVEVERTRPGYRPRPVPFEELPEERIAESRARLLSRSARDGAAPEVYETEARRAACLLVERPRGVREILSELPEESVLLGRAMVRRSDPEILVVDPARARKACPPNGREGVLNPSAVMFALALSKPEMSLVGSLDEARRLARSLETEDARRSPGRLLTEQTMEAAHRALERRRWTEWYARTFYEDA